MSVQNDFDCNVFVPVCLLSGNHHFVYTIGSAHYEYAMHGIGYFDTLEIEVTHLIHIYLNTCN